ncbi:alpha/beta hydrolase [Acidicapsa dinghuensis]|uniref:Alpha/beta hydrolase n=1 Tax=Acidicapsa dinghuensis TaxID=2218256 RepID=A0ABW1EK59_9BACT|nr:alpha/beta hydrolase [Acidicapsa dinghuensis]
MPKAKPSQRKAKPQQKPHASAFTKALEEMQHQPASAFPNVSGRWLLSALAVMIVIAAGCGWMALCLLYWQGSWQLLYHPQRTITKTPASAGLAFEPVHFWATESGDTRLTGWWIPSPAARFTMLYLHGADGDLSSDVDTLAALHRLGVNVLAIDYRGYGQSVPGKPSEGRLLEDANESLTYLEQSRHIAASSIVVYGEELGADIAAELTGQPSSRIAGVVLTDPVIDAMQTVFSDRRSRLVPAHWLVKDRYDLAAAASGLALPSLWLISQPSAAEAKPPAAYQLVRSPKMSVVLRAPVTTNLNFVPEISRWLDELTSPATR